MRNTGSLGRGRGYVDAANLPRLSKEPNTLLRKVVLYRGDITELNVDVIVNAANPSLLGGGGVDGAIHRKAGPELRAFNQTLGGCKTSEVKASPAFQLCCKQIFHTVGPRGEQPQALRACYQNALELLKKSKFRTIAFPCISTGIYGYPQLNAAQVVTDCVTKWLKVPANFEAVDFIVFCVFERQDFVFYEQLLAKVKCRAPVSIASAFAPPTSEDEPASVAPLQARLVTAAPDCVPAVHGEPPEPRAEASRAEERMGNAGDGSVPAEDPGEDPKPWGGSWVLCGGGEDATREEEDGIGDEDDRTRVFAYRGTQEGMELQPLKRPTGPEDSPCGSSTRRERRGRRAEEASRAGDTGTTRGQQARRESALEAREGGNRQKRRASVDEDSSEDDLSDECPAVRLVEKQERRGERRRRNERKDRRGQPERPTKKETKRRNSDCFDRHLQERVDAEERLKLATDYSSVSPSPSGVPQSCGAGHSSPPQSAGGSPRQALAAQLHSAARDAESLSESAKTVEIISGGVDENPAAAAVPVADARRQEPALEPATPSSRDTGQEAKLASTRGSGFRSPNAFPLTASAGAAPSPRCAEALPEGSPAETAAGASPKSGNKSAPAAAKRHKKPQSAEEKKKACSPPEGKRKTKQASRRDSQNSQESPKASATTAQPPDRTASLGEELSGAPGNRGALNDGEESHWSVTRLELPPVNPLAEGPLVGNQNCPLQSADVSSGCTAPRASSGETEERSKRPLSSVTPRSSGSRGGARRARKQRHRKQQAKGRRNT
ncbi:hypothetical protein NCLIV_016520 [Neospora caninum Liverpool]|nr:hypothetical protein NCLIV_016520 [Neospora caninum Liverpool]CBZ51860.1 hypothetical protein NCLIV_016520 [Neospora caninum Liverpool]|eukprot:XP_003881893.1 hypothetical protein NCLIV_016520 [Neospora caninum Liverpool]